MESLGSWSPSATSGAQRAGWQHEASSRVEREFRRSSVLNRMSGRDRALLRSQSGPVAGVPTVLTVDTDRARSVQGVASAAPCPPIAPFQPYLLVWPSTRRLWPPPCSVREVWGALEKRVRSGKRRWEGLQRGPGQGWPLTSLSEIWILECPMPTITGGSRLLPTACHCLAGSNSPWTQPSLLQFGEMANQCPVQADRDGVALRRAPSAQGSHLP